MIVHPTGKVESQIDYLASGVLRGEIQKGIGQTPYVQYGYLFPKLCLLAYTLYLLIIIVLWGWRRMDELSS
jgi:apolipoprotein N-acyltransferase